MSAEVAQPPELLFQTICTPGYDPFRQTLEVRMLFDGMEAVPETYAPEFESLRWERIFMDEAQYELEPFWNEKPSVEDFLRATFEAHIAGPSIAGTSLRLQKYRKVVLNYPESAYRVLPDYLRGIVDVLFNVSLVFTQ